MMNLLTLPFRIVFAVLRFFFFPWYLRWMFRLPWFVYFIGAAWLGNLAYEEYLDYNFDLLEAQLQIEEGSPEPVKLSQFDPRRHVAPNAEVNVLGLYLPALPGGTFDPLGLERGFIPLADDQGREVKAVLVVNPSEMTDLWETLAAQGDGDRVPVTVNGRYNSNTEWAEMIKAQLQIMNLPFSAELVVIEPFLGTRAGAIRETAEEGLVFVIAFGAIAGILAIWGIVRMASGSDAARNRQPATPKPQQSAVQVSAEPGDKIMADRPAVASPWGQFTPQPRTAQPTQPQSTTAAPQARSDPPKAKPKARRDREDEVAQPEFVSVFPGGGSGFRFKSADEIIRETFGTLSTLTRNIDVPKN